MYVEQNETNLVEYSDQYKYKILSLPFVIQGRTVMFRGPFVLLQIQ